MYYLRFSSNIESDIKRGHSYHMTHFTKGEYTKKQIAEFCNCDVDKVEYRKDAKVFGIRLDGLCCFSLESETLEDAIEESLDREFAQYGQVEKGITFILEGKEVWTDDICEGTFIKNAKVVHAF